MSARERILTIRLLEQAARHPAYAAKLGIVCAGGKRRGGFGKTALNVANKKTTGHFEGRNVWKY